MQYTSVKEIAKKFELSERRVQKLCETNRIRGCQMISGVWLIPEDAEKPSDERIIELCDIKDCLSLKELCNELSISLATGRNWIKLGKITPQYTKNRNCFFTIEYIEHLKKDLISGKNKSLKSRRNKKFVYGNAIYNSYVSEQCKNIPILQELFKKISQMEILLSTDVIQYIIADCALHLFSEKMQLQFYNQKHLLLKYLNNSISIDEYDPLVKALISNTAMAVEFCEKYPSLFELKYLYEDNEDILGLIYISCKNISERKATGSYYTPTQIVKKLISNLTISANDKILDPCCGTGNFLLQLPQKVSFDNIYGNDLDDISISITRINMALKYSCNIEKICQHITKKNFLSEYDKNGFQFIIGNPPWGYEYSKEEKEKLQKTYSTASKKAIESYDVFLERSFSSLTIGGQVSYILPEAVLNVKSHTTIRNVILNSSSIKYLEFLGNAFDGVQCPCIILQIIYTGLPLSTIGMEVNDGKSRFDITIERDISSNRFSFITTDEEYSILEKIKNISTASTLAGNADFALGIVTGNNKKYISSKKTKDTEVILKGADICKYHITQSKNFIRFVPQNFQQIAPLKFYRAPEKLLYRFICNELVFAYDDKQTLSLNSCNIVIPKLQGANMKYILAILNSSIAQFIYKKEFNSIKVLRSHIESIPIPLIEESIQNKIIATTELLINGQNIENAKRIYKQLDKMIFNIFQLTPKEQAIIKEAIYNENKFLTLEKTI